MKLPYVILCTAALLGRAVSQLDIQAALNAFCEQFPNRPGCDNRPEGSRKPLPDEGRGEEPCRAETKACPQRPKFCIPSNIDCSILESSQRCLVPEGFGVQTQLLLCGDGTPAFVRCADGINVPVLSQVLVQCHGAPLLPQPPVMQLGAVTNGGGAGIYRCGTSGSWEPMFDSPVLSVLTQSCSRTGCGMVPQSRPRQPVHRDWSWVRALYYRGKIHCSASLLTPTTALTAAHCLARSQVSSEPIDDLLELTIELPGPNSLNPRITTSVKSVHLHPRYTPQLGLQNDLGVVKFESSNGQSLPTVCLATNNLQSSQSNKMVLGLQRGFTDTVEEGPTWKKVEASQEADCITIGLRSSHGCLDKLVVRPFQFCAHHPGLSMIEGSSGGPFLVEVGQGVEEVWQVSGVLSHFSNQTSCGEGYSVYSGVVDDIQWLKNCVFNGQCS